MADAYEFRECKAYPLDELIALGKASWQFAYTVQVPRETVILKYGYECVHTEHETVVVVQRKVCNPEFPTP